VPRLLERCYRVRMLVRDPGQLTGRAWLPQVEVVPGDTLTPSALDQSMQGILGGILLDPQYGQRRNYYEKEIESARNFASAAGAHEVEHIIYLGGLADPDKDIGLHLRSRIQTGDTLRQACTRYRIPRQPDHRVGQHFVRNDPLPDRTISARVWPALDA